MQKAQSVLATYRETEKQRKQEISKLAQTKEALEILLHEAKPNLEKMKMEKEAEVTKQQWKETW